MKKKWGSGKMGKEGRKRTVEICIPLAKLGDRLLVLWHLP